MRVYLAAPYHRREELRGYRAELQSGITKGRFVTVTSRWLNRDPALRISEADLVAAPAVGRPFAQDDVEDVRSADLLVLFTEEVRNKHRGGCHVEFGLAIAYGKMLAVVGPRMNVFHTLGGVRHFHGGLNTPALRAEQGWRDCRDWILGGCK